MTWKRWSTSSLSRTAEGSSMTMSFVSWESARAMLTICCDAADREPTSAVGRISGWPRRGSSGSRLVGGGGTRDAEPGALTAEEDVVRDAQSGDQVELLVDGRDPQRHRGLRAGEGRFPPAPGDGAGVGLVRSGEHLDEGGLAGAVLAEQAVHL